MPVPLEYSVQPPQRRDLAATISLLIATIPTLALVSCMASEEPFFSHVSARQYTLILGSNSALLLFWLTLTAALHRNIRQRRLSPYWYLALVWVAIAVLYLSFGLWGFLQDTGLAPPF